MQEQLLSFKDLFESMVEKGMVDLTALDIINGLKKELLGKKSNAIKNINNPSDLFPIYHSINISNKVLDSIAGRLAISKETHDNPIIADDTLNIYPSLFMLLLNLDRINLNERDVITFHLLGLASDLQIDAIRSNLFKTDREIDNRSLLKRVKEVANDLKIGEPLNDR